MITKELIHEDKRKINLNNKENLEKNRKG